MSSKIQISVIMPARNVQHYIDESIQSVLDQRGVAFELLVADDASTDKTWERIRSHQNSSRLRAWRFSRRKGVGAARNYLMARAKGRYLALCDADDKLLPGFLRFFTRALDRNPKVGVAYGDRWVNLKSGALRRLERPSLSWDIPQGTLSNPGTIVRRSVIAKVGGYRTDLPYMEDCEWFWRLSEVTTFLRVRGKPLYFYRQRSGSLSNQFKNKSHQVKLKLLREVIRRRYGFSVPW
jgi:glycosyltransferase involved in cell wall biosynthesis